MKTTNFLNKYKYELNVNINLKKKSKIKIREEDRLYNFALTSLNSEERRNDDGVRREDEIKMITIVITIKSSLIF